jgi:hypothetical protein
VIGTTEGVGLKTEKLKQNPEPINKHAVIERRLQLQTQGIKSLAWFSLGARMNGQSGL